MSASGAVPHRLACASPVSSRARTALRAAVLLGASAGAIVVTNFGAATTASAADGNPGALGAPVNPAATVSAAPASPVTAGAVAEHAVEAAGKPVAPVAPVVEQARPAAPPTVAQAVKASTPVVAQAAPVAAPVVESLAPVAKSAAPVVESAAAVVESVAPVAKSAAPVVESVAPVAKSAAPVVESAAAVVESVAPVVESAAAVVSTAAPVVESVAPVVEAAAPVAEIDVPRATTPVADGIAALISSDIVNVPVTGSSEASVLDPLAGLSGPITFALPGADVSGLVTVVHAAGPAGTATDVTLPQLSVPAVGVDAVAPAPEDGAGQASTPPAAVPPAPSGLPAASLAPSPAASAVSSSGRRGGSHGPLRLEVTSIVGADRGMTQVLAVAGCDASHSAELVRTRSDSDPAGEPLAPVLPAFPPLSTAPSSSAGSGASHAGGPDDHASGVLLGRLSLFTGCLADGKATESTMCSSDYVDGLIVPV